LLAQVKKQLQAACGFAVKIWSPYRAKSGDSALNPVASDFQTALAKDWNSD